MNDKIDVAQVEVEELDVVDLGNAAVETRQHMPWPLYQDSQFGWGEWAR